MGNLTIYIHFLLIKPDLSQKPQKMGTGHVINSFTIMLLEIPPAQETRTRNQWVKLLWEGGSTAHQSNIKAYWTLFLIIRTKKKKIPSIKKLKNHRLQEFELLELLWCVSGVTLLSWKITRGLSSKCYHCQIYRYALPLCSSPNISLSLSVCPSVFSCCSKNYLRKKK